MKAKLLLSATLLCNVLGGFSQVANPLSEEMFANPPSEYKPRTWMHAMSGNMSKEGMTKDLEAISEVGIGGVLLFNIAQGIPYGNIKYNSPEHHAIIRHAASECERLGLTFGVHNCAGWSSSGGPWIKPEDSMKFLVSREVVVDGGDIDLNLPQPTMRHDFYKDVAVLAYPALQSDNTDFNLKPVITSSDKSLDLTKISDYRTDYVMKLHKGKDNKATITFDYGKPYPMRSLYISVVNKAPRIDLEISDDGKTFKPFKRNPRGRVGKKEWTYFNNFETPNARYYRIVVYEDLELSEVNFSSSLKLDEYIFKNSLARKEAIEIKPSDEIPADYIIAKNQIKDLTSNLFDNGRLKARLPKGKWTIMRIGYTTTGAVNFPASDSGRGLECDKFSAKAVDEHFNAFVKRVIDNVKDVAPNAMQYIEIDSYEMGGQNWTESFADDFKKRFGYDIVPFLPLALGKCIDNVQTSENVLSDFREMCAELMKTNYYDHFRKLCHENNIKLYVEPYGFGPFNFLDCGAMCDYPMGEFWMTRYEPIVRAAVSSGHIYGKNVISSESFTSFPGINWQGTPSMAKPAGDLAWTKGVNEFMFHRYAHQANTHVRPGMTMNKWGFHFDRTQTWWNTAGKEWFKYMRRGSYLLRQGVPVADILYFVGDATPNGDYSPEKEFSEYKIDIVNSDVLLNRVKVIDGKMVLPEGTNYRILHIGNHKKIKISTLRCIYNIVSQGVPMIGELPESLLGYNIQEAEKAEFINLITKIMNSKNYYKSNEFEKLKNDVRIIPDAEIINAGAVCNYFHRHLPDNSDIYFVYNQDSVSHNLKYRFRTTGKIPELWDAVTGETRLSENYAIDSSTTTVDIPLEGYQSMFVIFRKKAGQNELVAKKTSETTAKHEMNISTDWKVKFMKEYGYDAETEFPTLMDWKESANDEIKYYSGTATYSKTVKVDKKLLDCKKIILDLGDVQISAEIIINNRNAGVLWMTPFKKDITGMLKPGKNLIEIKVTNQWTNRLIGDERYPIQNGGYRIERDLPKRKMPKWYTDNKPMPAGQRMTFCTGQFYKKDSPLISAGLIGQVKIYFYQ